MTSCALILGGALLTVIVETSFFFLLGFRSRLFVWTCVLMNLFTNLTLNLLILWTKIDAADSYPLWLCLGEILAVSVEAFAYCLIEKRRRWEVAFLCIAANGLSFLMGLLYYWLLSLAGFSFR